MAIATDIINDCINKTKSRFFPLNKEWFKLGLISMLSAQGGSGNVSSNLTNTANLPGVGEFIKKNLVYILSGAGILMLFGLFWKIISLTFSFIFIDAVVAKNNLIVEGFKKHIRKGFSVFLVTLIAWFANLIFLGLLSLPILLPLVRNLDNLGWELFSIPYIIFFVAIFVLDIIVFGLFFWFVRSIVMYDMYRKNKLIIDSLKRAFGFLRKDFVEVLVFFLMQFLLGILAGIIALVAILILLIPFALVGIIIILILVPLAMVGGLNAIFFAIGGLIAFILILLFAYFSNVVLLPVRGFFINYSYTFVDNLSRKYNM
ncbi:MAG: DUF7544 domain-containing protein [Nanoarchaeota archaeon]